MRANAKRLRERCDDWFQCYGKCEWECDRERPMLLPRCDILPEETEATVGTDAPMHRLIEPAWTDAQLAAG